MRIGILGGTFNPIHFGHLIIAEQAYDQFALDKVLIMPSGVSYLKKDQKIPDGSLRFQMASLALEDNPHFEASDMEIKREGNTYTADTIDELRKMIRTVNFSLLPERTLCMIWVSGCIRSGSFPAAQCLLR